MLIPDQKQQQNRPGVASLGATALATVMALCPLSGVAQSASDPEARSIDEIVVTARRRDESLTRVPIAVSAIGTEELDSRQVESDSDLQTVVPGLTIRQTQGNNSLTYSIRGQSADTFSGSPSAVVAYINEVPLTISGASTFYDLESIQVLKGPQGTLFGRNTTGGAVLLTPKKPTEELEGYIEVSAGNYDMWRGQAVLNVPVTENFRLRLGVDHQEQDGYLDNVSGIGPDDFADTGYTAFRASAVWDLADNLENYTIFKMADSSNNGYPGSLIACNPSAGTLGQLCAADLASRQAAGDAGFHDVYSFVPEPVNDIESWQLINTTTWNVNDNFTVKGILSYADYETWQRSAIYGTNWQLPTGGGLRHVIFQQVGLADDRPTTDQETLVAELQFQGTALDERLTWQGGLYHEKSEPGDDYGAQSPAFINCDQQSITSPDPADFRCNNLFGIGAVQRVPGGVTYKNQAVYAQGTYDFTDTLALTVGLRYTDDETDGYAFDTIYYFPTDFITGGLYPPNNSLQDFRFPSTSSEEPTWLINLDYSPNRELLLYAKYARGYRQGSVNIGGSTGLDTHGPEKVDTYEIGAKTSFSGAVAGNFNVALFYNDFTDQQIQYGYFKPTGVGTTAILNAGESTIWGAEVESTLQLTDNLRLTASYAYLDTEVEELALPELPPNVPVPVATLNTTTAEGEPLSYAPENELVLNLNYQLPVDEALGEMIAGVTYVYTDDRQAVAESVSALATLPSYDLINLNFNWNRIAGSGVDLSLFATNVTDEEYVTFLTGNWNNGLEVGQVSRPRMYGLRLKYNF